MKKNQVEYKKPDTHSLRKQGLQCFDMHVHTEFSRDSRISLSELFVKMEEMDIGVAITDHNTIRGVQMALSRRPMAKIIPGIEITTKEAIHLLFYFYNQKALETFYIRDVEPYKVRDVYYRLNRTAREILDAAQAYGVLPATPHPAMRLFCGWDHLQNKDRKMLKEIEAVEVLNSSLPHRFNLSANKWARLVKKGMIGGSDAHTIGQVGTVVTCAKARNKKEFLERVAKKKNTVVGAEANFFKNIFIALFLKEFAKGEDKNLILKRVEYGLLNFFVALGKKKRQVVAPAIHESHGD